MPLPPEVIQQMKALAAFGPEQIDTMLRELEAKDEETWRKSINTLLLTLWTEHASTRRVLSNQLRGIAKLLQDAAAQAQGAEAAPEPITPAMPPPATVGGVPITGAPPPPMVGADGAPLSPDQAVAEQLMDEVAGPRGGGAPPQVQGGGKRTLRPIPQSGGPRVGADGKPLSAEEAGVEDMMDSVLGPR